MKVVTEVNDILKGHFQKIDNIKDKRTHVPGYELKYKVRQEYRDLNERSTYGKFNMFLKEVPNTVT